MAALLAGAERATAAIPGLLVAAERVARTVAQGVHGRRRVGQGDTFWQFRRYEHGDAAQAIDWRQSAKSRHIFVREREWEAVQTIWLWRDRSNSMRYRSNRTLPEKAERADLILLALAMLMTRAGEHVAVLGRPGRPGGTQMTLDRMALGLVQDSVQSEAGLPSPAGHKPLPRHARMVMVGDFLAPLAEIRRVVDHYVQMGVDGTLVHVVDPAEESLPFAGRIRFEGFESEGTTLVSRVENVRSEYSELMAEQRAGIRAIARSAGWMALTHHTDRPPETILLALHGALAAADRGW
jgi:uncharacterized protein (DUF58 family)